MNDLIIPPSPLVSLRRGVVRMWDDPDSRSGLIGVLGVVVANLLLFLLSPHLLNLDGAPNVIRPHANAQQFNIDLTDDMMNALRPPPKPPTPFKFVETNPNAPDNPPDKTNNFAAQNQQVAQEKPTPDGKSDRPAIEGQKEIHSTQIVSGQLVKQEDSLPPAPTVDTPPQEAAQQAPRQEQNPLSGFENKVGDTPDGYGSGIAQHVDGAKAIPEKIDGVKNAPDINGATSMQPQIDPRHPRPRPQVVRQPQVRPAIFEENKFGTQNIGNIGVDAKWSNYGAYLQKMIETVQIQWERILIESRSYPVSGTTVKVVFRMDSEGSISQIVNVEGTAGNQFEKVCTSAITARAPYGAWTDDMKAVLGESQEMTFTFYYQ